MTVEITKSDVEEMLEVDARSITRYQNREVDPLPIYSKGARGNSNIYCAKAILKWKVRRLKEDLMGKSGDGTILDYEKERARLTHGQANKAEMEVAVMKGELIPSEVVEEVMGDMVSRARSRLLVIPTKSAHALIGLTDLNEAQRILKENIYEALNELSEYDPEDFGIVTSLQDGIEGVVPST